jgi:hypothetical protein
MCEDRANEFFAALSILIVLANAGALASAQSPSHVMVTPDELIWSDMPTLPPGAKVAIIEGPLNEAVPFTLRLRRPANYEIPARGSSTRR